MLDYSPTKTQKLLGNPDKSANPTVSSPACAGLAEEHCTLFFSYTKFLGCSFSLPVAVKPSGATTEKGFPTKLNLNTV